MDNWTQGLTIFLAGTMAARVSAAAATRQMTEEELVREFGEHEGQPVETGFFFHEGKFVVPPYVVARGGLSVYVNEVRVRPGGWPPIGWEEHPTGMPPWELSENSTIDDLKGPDQLGGGYDRQFIRFVRKRYAPDEARSRIMAYYRNLPFVEDVTLVPSGMLKLAFRTGGSLLVVIDEPLTDPPTRDEVLRQVEHTRAFYEGRLSKGVCIFHFESGGQIYIGSRAAAAELAEIIEMAESDMSEVDKTARLTKMGLALKGHDSFGLMAKFVPSDELKARLGLPTDGRGGGHGADVPTPEDEKRPPGGDVEIPKEVVSGEAESGPVARSLEEAKAAPRRWAAVIGGAALASVLVAFLVLAALRRRIAG